MIFMAKMKKNLLDLEKNSSSDEETIVEIVQICIWILDSGCSKHMMGNRTLLTNFVEKFLVTVRFGNEDFAVIAGYGMWGLEVVVQKCTCFVQTEDCVDLLIDDRSSNLYTIALNDIASNSLVCLLANDSSSQSWLWHQRLSHLNFATINNLVKNNLVRAKWCSGKEKSFCGDCWLWDVGIRPMMTKKVYYVKGLGHNLFSVGQFCDKGLEVVVQKCTCFVQTEDCVDLLIDDRSSNLYTIALNDIASNSLVCLLANDSSSQSWLWHQRLSHLNFATINNLVKNNLVRGLPKMKFKKDHLFSACEQGKIHQKNHNSKTAFASNKPLYLLQMDLCGPIRVKSIIEKRYVLVVTDDYSCIEHANVDESLKDKDWVSAMQEELDQFTRLKVRRSVPRHGKEEGIDYDETFAPVSRIEAIRLFIAYAAHKDFKVFQIDVKMAFLNGILKEEVYVGQPLGFASKQYPNHVYALDKALYGLKPAPRTWYDVLSKFFIDSGFQKGSIDTTLFIKKKGKHIIMENYDTIPTPMVEQAKLKPDLVGKKVDHTDYRSMIGSLMYLTSSRPDIMFATCLRYSKDSGFDLTAYSETDHA
nr:retrovirus-related Pol polyprotein from transposon TNT 1-94 [Tanacetum cinerariifolium]